MILNGEIEAWHDVCGKKISALLGGIISKHHCVSYCLNCLHSFATKST